MFSLFKKQKTTPVELKLLTAQQAVNIYETDGLIAIERREKEFEIMVNMAIAEIFLLIKSYAENGHKGVSISTYYGNEKLFNRITEKLKVCGYEFIDDEYGIIGKNGFSTVKDGIVIWKS